MTNYYSNSSDYHNDLDAFEARVRAEQEEAELDEACKIEGSDTSMNSQLNDAGFGTGGVM